MHCQMEHRLSQVVFAEFSTCRMCKCCAGGRKQCLDEAVLCRPGLELDSRDQKPCMNLNECAVDNGGCQQTCTDRDPRMAGTQVCLQLKRQRLQSSF